MSTLDMITHLPYRRELFPGLGAGPYNWQDEETGVLSALMMKFFEQKSLLSPTEFEAVRAWGEYYLNAPCWDTNEYAPAEQKVQLAALRKQIADVRTRDELYRWIDGCLELGLDPY